jgi:hypothetical protein
MDQTQLQQNIAKYYAKLPVELQEVFSGLKWMEYLKNICTKYSLRDDQIETLATETTLVLLGIVHLEDYVLTLRKDLKLDEEIFNKILDELDAGILKNIKDDLVNTFELNVEFLNNENKQEDQVPLPPYVVSTKNEENLKPTEIIPQKPEPIEISQEAPKNIIEEKLKSATVSEHAVSDYTTRKINNLDFSLKSHDPYREEF